MRNSALTLLRYIWLDCMVPLVKQVRSETNIIDVDAAINAAADQNLVRLLKDNQQEYDDAVILLTQTGAAEARRRWGNGDG